MSQALRDLPDPTQPAPALPTANADDLLAKMADEAIDKLMAEADKGPTAPAIKLRPPTEEKPPEEAVVAEAAMADMLADAATPGVSTTSSPVAESGPSSDTGTSPTTSAEPKAANLETASPASLHESTTPADASTHNANAGTPAVAEPPKDDVKALLTEEAQSRPSPLLWPLWLLNAPFAWMSDRARQALGLIGIVTLVPAVCAIVYVLYMKKY